MFLNGHLKVYICRDRVDLRKSYEGLSLLVHHTLLLDPLSGHLFVFFNKRQDKVKVLYWAGDGFCLWQKRLEQGRFKLFSFKEPCWSLTLSDFHLLLSGVDISGQLPRLEMKGFIVS